LKLRAVAVLYRAITRIRSMDAEVAAVEELFISNAQIFLLYLFQLEGEGFRLQEGKVEIMLLASMVRMGIPDLLW